MNGKSKANILTLSAEKVAKAIVKDQQTTQKVGIRTTNKQIRHQDPRKQFNHLAIDVEQIRRKLDMEDVFIHGTEFDDIDNDTLREVYANSIRDNSRCMTASKGDISGSTYKDYIVNIV